MTAVETITPLTAQELAGVATALERGGLHLEAGLTASAIAGGRSNLTYRVTDGVRSWVLRMPPRTGRTPSAHDVAREHRVTAALRDSEVPVAEAVLLCQDETVLGGPFSVSGFVVGDALRTQEDLAELADGELARVLDSLLGALAALHRTDHVEVGLGEFGRPDGYAARQLRRWTSQWALTGSPDLERLADEVTLLLGRRVPDQPVSAIVHGDYRIDNTIVRDGQVAAVVDWELSTLGDPVADVALMCAYRDPAFDLIVGAPSAWTSDRLPGPAELAERYVAVAGRDLAHWDFHLGLASFKVAVIAAGIDHRRRSGGVRGPGFDTAAEAVPRFLELAHQTVLRASH